jgi:citrate lyase subunit beta/citryl-CoA lyase
VRDIQIADWMIGRLERERGLKEGSIDLMPLIETGRGLGNLREILDAKTRIRRVAFGAGDFSLDMNLQWTADELELLPYRNEIVMLSRWAGLEPPIDTVWINLMQVKDGTAVSLP